MKVLGSMAIAFSMYSKIPMPRTEWTKERMEYAMCFFPLVGAVIGGLYMGLGWLGRMTELSNVTMACLGAALPIIITGGIHMDGFADTVDALSSYQPAEKKLEILKDPHTGAFAIIGIVTYIIVFAGFFGEMSLWQDGKCLTVFAGVPVMGRAFSGLSVVCFPKAKKSGLAAMFSDGARKGAVAASMAVYLALSFCWFLFTGGLWTALILTGAGTAWFGYYYKMSKREFGGITGDIAGYFLQMEELLLLFALTAIIKVGMI